MKFSFSRFPAFVVVATLLIPQASSAQMVEIPDPNLRKAVREALELPADTPITQQKMLELVAVSAWGAGITDLTGLEHATFLHVASFVGNQIQDLRPLAGLTYLETVALERNPVSDISPLANLINLESLRLSGDGRISDITPLTNLTRLEWLNLSGQAVSDISPLANLTNLVNLDLYGNQIMDITPLIGLENLEKLYLAGNPIKDFTPLAALEGIELDIEIDLSQLDLLNLVVDVPDPNLVGAIRAALSLSEADPLTRRQMLRLVELDAQDSGITNLTGLEYALELQELRLCDNQIHDLRSLTGLVHLETLTLCANSLRDISLLANLIQLKVLDLSDNLIEDITPLANLTRLEELGLEGNGVIDITPLIWLKNLKKLRLADNPIGDFIPLLELEGVELDIEVDLSQLDPLNLVVYIPDPNLKRALREALELPEDSSITRREMSRLEHLSAWNSGITDLTGLEYATSLQVASFVGNQIQDLRPLSGLINLKTIALEGNPVSDISPLANLINLRSLRLAGNRRISDISPLASLTQLKSLNLGGQAISDITPLVNLTNLTYLSLGHNYVTDYSPLANLVNLEELWISGNPGIDFTPLGGLNLTEFHYDEVCEIPPLLPPVRERIQNRTFPSVPQVAFGIIGHEHLTAEQRIVLHDVHFGPSFDHTIDWDTTPTEPTVGLATSLGGNLSFAREVRQRRLDQNPNMVFIRSLEYHVAYDDHFPPDSDFWLRDENGQIIRKHTGHPFIDFLKPEVQALVTKRIIAFDRCGLYDGILFDGFGSNGAGFVGRPRFPYTDEEMTEAVLNILHEARKHIREDFLIIVNAGALKLTRFTEFINGSLMEIGEDHPGGYTHVTLKQVENTLSWNEENLREPRFNCLYGEAITIEPLDGPNNLRWMRVFTTMSLTLSDGYVLYLTDSKIGHKDHLWYDFWNADLGYPVGPKAQRYQNIEGTFIREFTNGWAVYNRSGGAQTITLPASAAPISDRGNNAASLTHLLPDLDGEIYLKPPSAADVNGDGKINILDLLQVANSLGEAAPDPNGDGVVNTLDLVFVAQQFSQ